MAAWFPNDAAMQNKFAVFGRGSTGSVYAFWMIAGNDSGNAPVVVFGSEGECLVLATNPWEFCRLLACGYDELEWDDLDQPSPTSDGAQPLRDWLKKHLTMEFPTTGVSIVSLAKELYPEFCKFVRDWHDANL